MLASVSISRILLGCIGGWAPAFLAITTCVITAYPEMSRWDLPEAIWFSACVVGFAGYLLPEMTG
jgi:hypothetical protein